MSEKTLSKAREGSVIIGLLGTLVATVTRWTKGSSLFSLGQRSQRVTADAVTTSSFVHTGRRTLSWGRSSYLYRWLTTEPDPQVVVIDLRTTQTVGPIVRALDWALTTVVAFARGSLLYRVSDETSTAVRQAPIRVASVALCVATFTSLTLAVLTSTVGVFDVVLHGVVIVLAFMGTQVRVPIETFTDSRTFELLQNTFEPPERRK